MIEDLQARFLPQFVTSARERVHRALDLVERRDLDALHGVARELHSIAGESGLLGLRTLMPLARTGEELARRTHSSQSEEDALALASALRELARSIEGFSQPPTGGQP